MNKIESLSLILSCGCNLSCEYCLIAKSINENSKNIQEKTREYLKNGQFLQNCIKTLKLMGQDPLDITHIEFWGQEPTLNLDLYTSHLKDWHKTFPNIKSYMFSTNGKAYPEKIISFLIELDKYANQGTLMTLQFSYDGKYSNSHLRKISSDVITNNLLYFFTELNKINFNNIHILIQFNGVITRELLYELNTIEKLQNFLDHGQQWLDQFYEINKNSSVEMFTGIPFSPEVPFLCTKQDGIQLNNFYLLLKSISEGYTKEFLASFLRGFNSKIKALKENEYTEISIVDALKFLSNLNFKTEWQKNLYNILSSSQYCGSNFRGLKIMYDGTLIECHNLIFDTELEYIKYNSSEEYAMKKNLIDKKRIINLLQNENPQEVKTLLYRGSQIEEESFFSTFNNAMNLLYTMSCCGQAEKDYMYNKEKLLLHAYILTRINTCSHDRRVCTGSASFINSGMVRFFCNGFLSLVIDDEGRIKELL